MDRKKFGVVLVALVTGVVLSAGSALAQSGYLMGDPATGKLIPFYRTGPTLSTLIGFTNTEGDIDGPNVGEGDLDVHVTIFSKRSVEILDFDLCLSPSDFGFLVLQHNPATAAQNEELFGPLKRFHKARIFSVTGDGIPAEGYVTMAIQAEFNSQNGTCNGLETDEDGPIFPPTVDVLTNHTNEDHLATWAILAEVGSGFYATEIPTPTAIINPANGKVFGGPGAYGLIPKNNTVLARFDVNPDPDSQTEIFVWLNHNNNGSLTAFLDCEDEFRISTTIPLPDEVNTIDPDTLAGIGQCKNLKQYRGNLLFDMPDTGFLWSQITQVTAHFRQNYLGYNLGDNDFIDCADGVNDFVNKCENSDLALCSGPAGAAGTCADEND
jgi:hypothetical protein